MPSAVIISAQTRNQGEMRWKDSNRALGNLIARHRSKLGRAATLAERIRFRLESLFPLLDRLVRLTCPWCPEPCCIVNKAWFDFQDLLFLHLTRQQIPPAPLTLDPADTCRYLSLRGCILPRIIRPWTCTGYICPTQMRRFSGKGLYDKGAMQAMLDRVSADRMDMEDAFVTMIRRLGGGLKMDAALGQSEPDGHPAV